MIQTYQDFLKANDKVAFCLSAINKHRDSEEYKIALDADRYDRQQNTTIMEYTKKLWTLTGSEIVDFTASNNKIVSNFFRTLNTQRNAYLLGNGVQFTADGTKEKLGRDFDTQLKKLGYKALIHGVCFGFWNVDKLHIFPLTEFVPLWDEETGALMAGIRFWQIHENKPLFFNLYEVDGYTRYKKSSNGIEEVEKKRAYVLKVASTVAFGEQIIGEENYSALPIIPLYGSEIKQSTLVGMKRTIDSYDLIRSGFANDLNDCAQIYWIVKNAGGMRDSDLNMFRDRLKTMHIADVDSDDNNSVMPVTQDIPYNARMAYLENIRHSLYEDFCALDVTSISGGAKTATEINAAYDPLDKAVDDYEYQIIEFIHALLKLLGIDDTPIFKRSKIANRETETQMILSAGTYLDQQTVLEHLPFLTVDEVDTIMKRTAKESMENFNLVKNSNDEAIETENEEIDS